MGIGVFDFLSPATLSGSAATDFAALSEPAPALAANAQVSLTIAFAPSAPGSRSATISFATDSRLTPSFGAGLAGTGVDPASLALGIEPAALDFGDVHLPLAETLVLLLLNPGQDPLPVGTPTISGPQAASFSATLPALAALAPGAAIELPVTFTPRATGLAQATLLLTACRLCTPQAVALTGRGRDGALAFLPPGLEFGTIRQDQLVALPISIVNDGQSDIVLTGLQASGDAGFAVVLDGGPALPVDLAPGASYGFFATYQTTGPVGALDSALLTAHTGYDHQPLPDVTAPLDGEVGSDCVLAADPAQIDFDFAVPNAYAPQQVVVLANKGRDPCILEGFAIEATSDQGFSIAGALDSGVLGAFSSAEVTLAFSPSDTGEPWQRNGTLVFTTSDPYNQIVRVPLTGKTQSDAYARGSAWPRWGHDNGNTNLSTVDTSATTPTLRWRTLLNALFPTYGTIPNVPSLGADGTIYLLGPDQYLYAVSAAGNFLWTSHAEGRPTLGVDLSDVATPAIAADGTILGLLYLRDGVDEPQLFAFSTTGTPLWRTATGLAQSVSPPMLRTDGLVEFAGLTPVTDAGILVIPADGGAVFQVSCPACAHENSVDLYPFVSEARGAMAADGTSYWISGDASVSEVLADGGPGWTTQFASCSDAGVGVLASLILFDGGVYVQGYGQVIDPTSYTGIRDCDVVGDFDARSGVLTWQYCGQGSTGSDPLGAVTGAIVPGGGYVAALTGPPFSADISLERIDPPGVQRWSTSIIGVSLGEAVGADGTIYVTGPYSDYQLVAIDSQTGVVRWQYQNLDAGGAASAPIIGADGTIYFTDVNGYLNAVR